MKQKKSTFNSYNLFLDVILTQKLVLNCTNFAFYTIKMSAQEYVCEVKTRFDVYETLCPQQMLVHKEGQLKNWSGECRDIIPTKLQCQTIQRALQSPNLQREIIRKK